MKLLISGHEEGFRKIRSADDNHLVARDVLYEDAQEIVRCVNLQADSCRWEQDDDGIYQTDCDGAFVFDSDGIKANKFVYCPYCGKRIQEEA